MSEQIFLFDLPIYFDTTDEQDFLIIPPSVRNLLLNGWLAFRKMSSSSLRYNPFTCNKEENI